ncbi:flavin reductase [Enterovirga rhinocerotis]|uniref:3-hydroxy-9,10-secoandrosta-1,3,5(10)-triene-9, 17-dione monooxygenase reductase component n=1 Tax=Enterovirga rhinocerotis TaxID=1339210 RepID=A0A4R7BXA3_9HYPH|nr:flavin reductase [Enterovirga rhinocerotis]TDR90211.1 3-hydroxy-9,10-secoandrosta-1,3,5(10)-triene-9,17-dione monooxygenase reductase component [Enterovirga rhinocerotis]
MTSDAKSFRNALGAFATGVTIVTTRDPEAGDVGMTANSFNSVSLDPPMILWSLGKSSSNIDTFRRAGSFAVHVLAAHQAELSTRFATRGVDRFQGLAFDRGEDGTPLLRDCTARFECRTAFQHEGGDHVIFVGEVTRFTHSQSQPLAFHGGDYAWVVKRDRDERSDPTDAGNRSLSPVDLLYHIARAYHHLRHDTVQERLRLGWSEAEYFTIAMLSMHGPMTLPQLAASVEHRGYGVTRDVIDALRQRGMIEAPPAAEGETSLGLTEAGRAAFIEVIAIAKATEADATESFTPAEVQLLKRLLQRLLPAQDARASGWSEAART